MLDTNICIYVINERLPEVRRIFNERADQLCISSASLAELHYGAGKSSSPARSLSVVGSFAARLEILPFEETAAAHYGEIRIDPERAGTPIGPYDLMIAGHARSRGMALVTNNTRNSSGSEDCAPGIGRGAKRGGHERRSPAFSPVP